MGRESGDRKRTRQGKSVRGEHRLALPGGSLIARGWSRYNARAVGQPGSRCASRRNGQRRQAREERAVCLSEGSHAAAISLVRPLARGVLLPGASTASPYPPIPTIHSRAPASASSPGARVLQLVPLPAVRPDEPHYSITHAHRDRTSSLPAPWLTCMLACDRHPSTPPALRLKK